MITVERINNYLTFGMYGWVTRESKHHVHSNTVAAGNPEKLPNLTSSECDFPVEFIYNGQSYHLKDYSTYCVSGNSMSPEGIYNGDALLAQQSDSTEIERGDFIVIKVDHDFYRKRHQDYEPYHDFKLRKAIGLIPFKMTEEEVCAMLAEVYEELILPEYNQAILENLKEARDFYHDQTLYASVTYPDGKMHISFHAASLISSKVVIIGRKENGGLRYISPDELQKC